MNDGEKPTVEEEAKPENQPSGKWMWLVLGVILLVMLFAMLKSGGVNPSERGLPLKPLGQTNFTSTMGGADQASPPEAASKAVVSGVIAISNELKSKVKPGSVIYVIARQPGVEKGPTIAALRIDVTNFPVAYTLSEENLMVTGAALEGKLDISARLDQDGDAGTREKGDISGACKKNPVSVGATDADIVLDSVITEEYLPQGHPGADS